MNVLKFYDFINERSKNDPIPEIYLSEKVGIILLGTPGIGKSTFCKDFILPKNNNFKIFSTDDVSLAFTKDPNVYKKGSSELNLNRLSLYIKNGGDFIYDTTGVHYENIERIFSEANKENYKLIFIHLVGPLDISIKQNRLRDRNVPEEYISSAYERQYMNMRKFLNLNPDSYYIVQSNDGKYKFSKYTTSGIIKNYLR